MYITFQNIKTKSIDFDMLIGKYLCFLNKGIENLKMSTGYYVTNCNYIYKVIGNTNCFMIVEATFSNGETTNTKLDKKTFEKNFFDGSYVISDEKPAWGVKVGTYSVELPDYEFRADTDTSKAFSTEEINELLAHEFLNTNKSYRDVQNCIETLTDIVMKRYFDYVSIARSYFQSDNCIQVGLNIETGNKYLPYFGEVKIKSYRQKIKHIEFVPCDWLDSYNGFADHRWNNLNDLIIKYLVDNKSYIDTLV